jgi:hypothetical protein
MSTYRKEWPCCGSVTETQAWEPEECPFCTTTQQPVLDGVEDVDAADNQWFGDMMILQVLADSENVNDQEREVLTRWMAASPRPSQARAAGMSENKSEGTPGVTRLDQGQPK